MAIIGGGKTPVNGEIIASGIRRKCVVGHHSVATTVAPLGKPAPPRADVVLRVPDHAPKCETCHTRRSHSALSKMGWVNQFRTGDVHAAVGLLVVLVRGLGAISPDLPDAAARQAPLT
jgi:hypothetical protein